MLTFDKDRPLLAIVWFDGCHQGDAVIWVHFVQLEFATFLVNQPARRGVVTDHPRQSRAEDGSLIGSRWGQ